jgi:hypothetical protein
VSRAARRALRVGVRTLWAFQGPDGDLAYFGRSQGQSWALALAAYAAARAAGGSCSPPARAFRSVAERALDRLGRSIRSARRASRSCRPPPAPRRSRRSTTTRARSSTTASRYRARLGREQRAARQGCRPGRLLSDRSKSSAVLPFQSARFATIRRGRVWMAVKQRSQRRDGRAAFGIRALKRRGRDGEWVDLLPAAPTLTGTPRGSFGPALLLRSGVLAEPRGTRIAVRGGAIVVRGGWRHGGRWVRRGVRFSFRPEGRGARIAVSTARAIRSSSRRSRSARPSPPAEVSRTRSHGRARRCRLRSARSGPFASSSSLSVWRSDLTVRAPGRRVQFRVIAR